MRNKIDYRTASKAAYTNFCNKNTSVTISYEDWKSVIYGFNELFKIYALETGDDVRLPHGFGDFRIKKKKRKKRVGLEGEFNNLPIDWKKSKEKGKKIYNFNFHTEGYFFGWVWNKNSTRLANSNMWYFKACRVTSRLLAHYLKADAKYQHIYRE